MDQKTHAPNQAVQGTTAPPDPTAYRVFYGLDPVRVIDVIDPEDESADPVGRYGGWTLEQLRKDYGSVEIGDLGSVVEMQNAAYCSAPVRIEEASFFKALECLPPEDWQITGAGETFKMCERLVGSVTTIYARVRGTCWSMNQHHTLTHGQIVALVQDALAAEAGTTAAPAIDGTAGHDA